MVMSILRMTLCAQVGFLFVKLGERVVVAFAMLAACDICCLVHERGGNTASMEFIGGGFEEAGSRYRSFSGRRTALPIWMWLQRSPRFTACVSSAFASGPAVGQSLQSEKLQ